MVGRDDIVMSKHIFFSETICLHEPYLYDVKNNTQLLAKSKVLSGYMIFVNRVRGNLEHQKKIAQNASEYDEAAYEEDLEAAINEAIDYCIEHHIMETFFRENRSEVTKSMVLDYTWERREELIRAEEYEDGRREGIQLGEEKAIQNLMHTMNISDREARKLLGFDKTAKKNEGI